MRYISGIAIILLLVASVAQPSAGGPAYGLCQAACAAGVVACYTAAGFVFGTVIGGRTEIINHTLRVLYKILGTNTTKW